MDTRGGTRPVVVGVDGSVGALRATRWAAGEAVRRHAPLRVVTALSPHRGAGSRVDYADVVLGRSRCALADAVGAARHCAPTVRVDGAIVAGLPRGVLRAESERAQLLVVGDRGSGGVGGPLLGSVAVSMGAHALCPVVMVRIGGREPVEDRNRPVVVGVDGASTADAALAFAFDAAASRGVPLVALLSWWDPLLAPAFAPMVDWDGIAADRRRFLDEQVTAWARKHPGVAVEPVLTPERPAQALVAASESAQLVVVGSRGRGVVAGALLGSVGHAVLHGAHCSVAVVRPDTTGGAG